MKKLKTITGGVLIVLNKAILTTFILINYLNILTNGERK